MLHRRGKLYCPDYVVNAGGIIAIYGESAGDTVAEVRAKVEAIPARLVDILKAADRSARPPEAVADDIARERIGRSGKAALDRRMAPAAEPA